MPEKACPDLGSQKGYPFLLGWGREKVRPRLALEIILAHLLASFTERKLRHIVWKGLARSYP